MGPTGVHRPLEDVCVFRDGVSRVHKCKILSDEARSNLIIEHQNKLVVKWPSLLFSIWKVLGSVLGFGQRVQANISSCCPQSL
jgi:hypothetical protein